jgi:hypothetical protein
MKKSIFKTKTFWGGVASVITGIGICVAGDVPTGAMTILGGIQTIFIRDAMVKSPSK